MGRFDSEGDLPWAVRDSICVSGAARTYSLAKLMLTLCNICPRPSGKSAHFDNMKVNHVKLLINILSKTPPPNCHLQRVHQLRGLSVWGNSKSNDWKRAVSDAEKIVGYPTSFMSLRCLLSDELANVALQVRKLVGTKHPLLKTARGFLDNGKHSLQTRGLIVLLIAKSAGAADGSNDQHEMVSGIYPRQRTLAEITEMIHTANLVHKGVVNLDALELDTLHKDMEFGNKISILSGDFLLASASTGLADLRNTKVVETVSRAIGNMMEAEFTPLRDHNGQAQLAERVTFADWEKQTYLQSGSLLAKSCEAALELAGHSEELKIAAARYGENLAYARQLHEDIQLFIEPTVDANGIWASAPVIHYAETTENTSSLNSLSISELINLVNKSPALDWCIQRCKAYGQEASSAINVFSNSDARQALVNIVNATTNSSKTRS